MKRQDELQELRERFAQLPAAERRRLLRKMQKMLFEATIKGGEREPNKRR